MSVRSSSSNSDLGKKDGAGRDGLPVVAGYASPEEAMLTDCLNTCPVISGRAHQPEIGAACADLIVTDVVMPGITGLAFVKILRDTGCRVRHIAMMSGQWEESDKRKAEDMGCRVFCKPFSLKTFHDWVQALPY